MYEYIFAFSILARKYIDKRVKLWGGTLYDSSDSQMEIVTDNDGVAEKRSDS